MKNIDVLVVRCLPFLLFLIIGFNIVASLAGLDITNLYLLQTYALPL